MSRSYSSKEVREIVAEAIAPLLARIAELEAEVARLKKDSSTSSKPPSSDIVNPKAKTAERRGKKRRKGGQPGHRKHQRKLFAADQINATYEYELSDAEGLAPLNQWRVVQQVELVERPFVVTEHRARRYRCRRTGKIVTAALPRDVVRAGLVGPRLSAWIAYLKGACHMSYASIQTMLKHVTGLSISTGQLVRVIGKVSQALGPAYEELQQALPHERYIGVDETGHKENGQGMWTWCFHAPGKFSCFRIAAFRSSSVPLAMLGDQYTGVLGCDYFSAYRKLAGDLDIQLQFCWAHLIRDVKFLTTLSDKVSCRFGHKLLTKIRKMFCTWHQRDELTSEQLDRRLKRARDDLLAILRRAPNRAEIRPIAERFRKHGRWYFTFMDEANVEPTNNATERAIRHVVIDRKITQGTRSTRGREWNERIWSVLATSVQRSRSPFDFLLQAVNARFNATPAPRLLS